jgi:hypothetical protein
MLVVAGAAVIGLYGVYCGVSWLVKKMVEEPVVVKAVEPQKVDAIIESVKQVKHVRPKTNFLGFYRVEPAIFWTWWQHLILLVLFCALSYYFYSLW